MMKTLGAAALLAIGLLLPVASPASAATDWSGFYVGLNVGGGMTEGEFSDGCYYCATDTFNEGFVEAGGQLGMNWQTGVVVIGAEGDIQYTNIDHSGILGTDDFNFTREKQKMQWFASLRARAGIAVDNALFYVTAGPALGSIDAPGVELCCGPKDTTLTPTGFTFSESDTRIGLIGGVGMEWTMGGNWSMRGEYLYVDFGNKTAVRKPDSGSCSTTYICEIHNRLSAQIVRVAFNYHLGR